MNLTNETIQQTYGNLLTIGTTAGTPTQGTLQNGAGQNVSNLTLDELEVNKLIQTQATIAASGTSLSSATLLTAGVNLVTSSDVNNIAVKLPQPQLGLVINIVNTSTRDIKVYPYSSTDSILGRPAGEAYTIPADGQLYQVVCVQNPNVGVWSVVTPYNGVSAVKNYTVDMVVGDGIGTTVGTGGGVVASVDVISSGGNVIHREFILGNNGNMPLMDINEFAGFSQVRMKSMVVKTNIPTGDFSTQPTAGTLPFDEMGLTLAQFNTLKVSMNSAVWDYTDTTQVVTYSSADLDKMFSSTYNAFYWNYLNGTTSQDPSLATNGGYTHYVATPSDLAYDSNNPSTRYQKHELTFPNVVGEYSNWVDIFDTNGNPARYIGFDLSYSDGSNPASGFPSGFEFKASISIDWELK